MEIIELNEEQIEEIEDKLSAYDQDFIKFKLDGTIQIGIKENGKLIAGLDACMTAFKILYVSTVFVEEPYRRKGYGTKLMQEMENRARKLGANIIRLDTFNWQGKDFYEAIGYEMVGSYENKLEGYSEHFFLKRLD